ncbi:hypothetical protein E4U54_003875 [Claviceps lovelessii]|nr:hypothetical protein E4U54_003875 [Claviceps lovelessii]
MIPPSQGDIPCQCLPSHRVKPSEKECVPRITHAATAPGTPPPPCQPQAVIAMYLPRYRTLAREFCANLQPHGGLLKLTVSQPVVPELALSREHDARRVLWLERKYGLVLVDAAATVAPHAIVSELLGPLSPDE